MTLTKPKSVSATASANTISGALSQAIHEHRLAPGTKLGEDELSDIYGVSRTIVRTALQSLAHQQIIEIKRNRGAYVAQPSLTEAHEVFEARELLEPRTARSAARHATPDDIALLNDHVTQEHAAMDAGDRGRALSLSGQFHIEIARIAQQQTIADIINVLIARSSLIIALYWRRENALCESQAHHALIKAIGDNDGVRAEELMQSHLVDLHSALNLNELPVVEQDLRSMLMGEKKR
ncbi:GntR family transcriptional regulator [Octadecabacter sp. G9-8]|uniref:GntR family transcriptional regulator n=1 Tax=Octadecabacter dasysiphoniae TaxID=2909341 RepID=A0ABS9CYK3_9RHOB|nr:GntR family transcriptional regulator [Octadecabacter dasysiphoniae]MCF2872350.1 GntR family transcriptional regulator [Octadecabacter dasysiphoniae]